MGLPLPGSHPSLVFSRAGVPGLTGLKRGLTGLKRGLTGLTGLKRGLTGLKIDQLPSESVGLTGLETSYATFSGPTYPFLYLVLHRIR